MVPTLFFQKKENIHTFWVHLWGTNNATKTPLDSPLGRSQFFVKTKKTYSERRSAKTASLISMPKTFKKPLKKSKSFAAFKVPKNELLYMYISRIRITTSTGYLT